MPRRSPSLPIIGTVGEKAVQFGLSKAAQAGAKGLVRAHELAVSFLKATLKKDLPGEHKLPEQSGAILN